MKTINKNNVSQWVERFLNGDTTCEEEHALFEYFKQEDLPADLEKYREMMAWYAAGLSSSRGIKVKRYDDRRWKRWQYAIAIVSVIAVVAAGIGLFLTSLRASDILSTPENVLYAAYQGSYKIENGVRNENLSQIIQDVQECEFEAEENADALLKEALEGIDDPHAREIITNALSDDLI